MLVSGGHDEVLRGGAVLLYWSKYELWSYGRESPRNERGVKKPDVKA